MSVSLTHHQKEVDEMHKLSTILHFLIGICATVSGISLMIDSSGSIVGLSTTDLVNGPFTSFWVPGLLLIVILGLGNFLGWWAGHRNHVYTPSMSLLLGLLLLIATLFESWVVADFVPSVQIFGVIGLIQFCWGWVLRRDYVARTNCRNWHGKRTS